VHPVKPDKGTYKMIRITGPSTRFMARFPEVIAISRASDHRYHIYSINASSATGADWAQSFPREEDARAYADSAGFRDVADCN